ncbi:MAG: hypothetical protein JNL58_18345 [Planctomyces sp.]|nr:hypothetical protein [Planctomyces sp.]
MTIRYTCTTCSSVLKIKDEKAGTEGKCPKCKSVFTIPMPESEVSEDEPPISLDDEDPEPDLGLDDVDVPIDLTPEVRSDDFDPMDVLASTGSSRGGSRTPSGAMPTAPASAEKKPSVAELMKDFEAGKKNKKAAEPPKSAAPSPAQTTGTAADALSRAYQQKRDPANTHKSPKNEREEEEKQLRNEWMKRAGLALLGAMILIYALFTWLGREVYTGPPLYDVYGKVTRRGQPVPGLTVLLVPVPNGTDVEERATSRGITDLDGNFTMMYTGSFAGAPLGSHKLQINDLSGMPMLIPDEHTDKVVTDEKNEFIIDLQ